MKLLAVRHGETEWSKIALQQGHLDSPLTDLGVLQATALADGSEFCSGTSLEGAESGCSTRHDQS